MHVQDILLTAMRPVTRKVHLFGITSSVHTQQTSAYCLPRLLCFQDGSEGIAWSIAVTTNHGQRHARLSGHGLRILATTQRSMWTEFALPTWHEQHGLYTVLFCHKRWVSVRVVSTKLHIFDLCQDVSKNICEVEGIGAMPKSWVEILCDIPATEDLHYIEVIMLQEVL